MRIIAKVIYDYKVWGAYSLFTSFLALAIVLGYCNRITAIIGCILWIVMCLWALFLGHHEGKQKEEEIEERL